MDLALFKCSATEKVYRTMLKIQTIKSWRRIKAERSNVYIQKSVVRLKNYRASVFYLSSVEHLKYERIK